MTTVEPPENDAVSDLEEERRVHRERREGTLEGASEEAKAKAEEHRRNANPSTEEDDENDEQPTQ